MTHWIDADDFVLDQASRLDSIRFWDFEVAGNFHGSLTWQIYSDSEGRPGQLLFSGTSANLSHVATGFIAFGPYKEYVTDLSIPPISLPRGTYWLGLHNGPLSNNVSDDAFYWEATTNKNGPASYRKIAPFSGSWVSNAFPTLPPDLAFSLFGAALPNSIGLATRNGTGQISFSTVAGYSYRVDYRDSLSSDSWTVVPGLEAVGGTGGVVQVTDISVGSRGARFYRVAFSYSGAGKPVISTFRFESSGLQISFNANAGYYYRVEYKENLQDSTWRPVSGAEAILGAGATVQVIDTEVASAAQSRRFYRVILF